MNFIKFITTSSLLFFFSYTLFAQATVDENSAILCSDGIDNDDDGLIDCYDGDCYNFVSSCHETTEYLEDNAGCKVIIPTTDRFTLVEEWRTTNVMYDSRIPLVGDVDNDGRTEVVASNEGFTYVIDGETGIIKSQIDQGINGTGGLAIADLDKGDGTTQIFFVSNGTLTRLNYNGSSFTSSSTSSSNSETVNIADFNEDGDAEIFVDGQIYTEDLSRIMTLPVSGGTGRDFAVAVDILPQSSSCATCDGLEFVAGTKVYAVNINDGTYSVAASLDTLGLESGYTAVVDMNDDDELDIIVADNVNHKVYVWSPVTEKLLSTPYELTTTGESRTNMGRPNIGDFDNDGKPEIGMATQVGQYMVLDVNATDSLIKAASTSINDYSSGFTGSSVYDFEGDGINEIVYRDQDSLRVYRQDGSNLNVIGSIACRSLTRHEYPVVVDVDNDDATEILCACANPDRRNASIISVSASNTEWIRARKVWNQHSYFNVNVNDDLTIPQYQSKHHLFPNQALNNFLVQSTYVDPVSGLPTSKGRDIAIDTSFDAQVEGFCDHDMVIYKYKIINRGNLSIPSNTAINYSYDINNIADQKSNGDRISFIRNVNEIIPAGDTLLQVDTVEFRGVPFNVVIKLNTEDPTATAISTDKYIYGECNSDNKPYHNNFTFLSNLDTCKELKALNDTITVLSSEVVSWSSILDNDIINFSAEDFNGFKFNFKRYIDTLTTNAFSNMTPGTSITDIIADSTIGEGNVSFTYTPLDFAPIDSILIDSFQYEICHSTIPNLCSSAWVFIRFEYQSDVPEGFNANDGVFEIPNFNVEFFPENIIKIYNRWGNKVYEASPYNNDWDGKSSTGQELPVGTYFYVLDRRKEGFKIETGFVYLNR